MNISLPLYVKTALNTLEANGFECFCVGGAIRDLCLGKTPFDFDITTNATPEDIIRIFDHTVPTGLKHGTVTVIIERHNIEITTYRSEEGYSDHRAPDSVKFLSSVETDVMRRDFTMNAILYNPNVGIYDPQNGLNDINSGLIRAVGVPKKRFTEDALRIMRAFRFSAQLNFSLEKETYEAAIKLSNTVEMLSRERIFDELKKIIKAQYPQNSNHLFECGALEFLGLNIKTSLESLCYLPCDFPLRFAYLCHLNSLDCKTVLKALKCDNETITECEKTFGILNSTSAQSKYDLKVLLNKFGIDAVKKVLSCNATIIENKENLLFYMNEITDLNEPYRICDLNINGNDLKTLGFSGEKIGKVLEALLDKVMLTPELNTFESLKELSSYML